MNGEEGPSLTQDEINILLRIKNDHSFLEGKGFDNEKGMKLLDEIKIKAKNTNDPEGVIQNIIVSLEKRFSSNDHNISDHTLIEDVIVNKVENVVNKISMFAVEKPQEIEEDLKPLT